MNCLRECQGRKDMAGVRLLHTPCYPRRLAKICSWVAALAQWPLLLTSACQHPMSNKIYHRESTCKCPWISVGRGKRANPGEQTTAHGFAFAFISENEAVSSLRLGLNWGETRIACTIWIHLELIRISNEHRAQRNWDHNFFLPSSTSNDLTLRKSNVHDAVPSNAFTPRSCYATTRNQMCSATLAHNLLT